MLGQLSHKFTGLALLVALAGVGMPAQAEPQEDGQLLSQLRGHETFAKEPQMNPDDYVIGRVRAVIGSILFIQLMEPYTIGDRTYTHFHLEGSAASGDDVIFRKEDDGLVFVGVAHPAWITRLKLKDESEFVTSRAAIWKELEETKEVGLPPLPPEQRTFVTEPEPVRETTAPPVRGLW